MRRPTHRELLAHRMFECYKWVYHWGGNHSQFFRNAQVTSEYSTCYKSVSSGGQLSDDSDNDVSDDDDFDDRILFSSEDDRLKSVGAFKGNFEKQQNLELNAFIVSAGVSVEILGFTVRKLLQKF